MNTIIFALENGNVSVESQAVTFAIVGGILAFLTLWYTTRSKRRDLAIANASEEAKEIRHEIRLKAVEDQAAVAAKLLEESNHRVQEARQEQMQVLKILEEHQGRIERSQDIMHAMLNSAQTTQMLAYIVTMKASRASLRTQYAQMKELAYLRVGVGTELSDDTISELTALQDQITALGGEISANQDAVDDRMRAQELAESIERNKNKFSGEVASTKALDSVSAMVPPGSPDPTVPGAGKTTGQQPVITKDAPAPQSPI